VKPWELGGVPKFWRERAEIAVMAEMEAKHVVWVKRNA